jgi:hypothetical protein
MTACLQSRATAAKLTTSPRLSVKAFARQPHSHNTTLRTTQYFTKMDLRARKPIADLLLSADDSANEAYAETVYSSAEERDEVGDDGDGDTDDRYVSTLCFVWKILT